MRKLLAFVVAVSVFAMAASTVVNLATQVTGVLPLVNGGTGGTSYVKGVFHTFCTGTAVTGATTNFDFPGFGSTATICSTALTTASGGTKITTAGTVKNLFVNLGTAGKSGDKIQLLKNGSSTGAPTCTYGASTSCSDTSTALTVAQGDVITISNLTSASETAANISVSFELWN